jgi:glycosyltransferase A (GT-A) superfamily protein (DUF2064 family)
MAEDVIRNVADSAPVALFHDGLPEGAALPSEWLRLASFVLPQEGRDLGEKMASAFQLLFAGGCERAVLAGSDAPGLDGALVDGAFASLDRFPLSLSPSPDGGYCLVAWRAESYYRRVFEGIPWGTEEVLDRTLERCAEGGREAALLAPRRDVDTLASLRAYCLDPAPCALSTNRCLRKLALLPS